ncbi:hypothetical protein HMPREF9595_02566 [Cutibacterium acnes HL005PA2]|nr:hypothetical protein HMPREF9574_02116 [Cutibacterium acnes HL074PA1]EFS70110.1 hypothetical protein HMPREF9616_00031 [Cutibacterium acnes HL007PA1]EFS71885.1 hypothetical protein HMPREF9617_00884 [Cutibacterium acnes HL056PA1]EFT21568.1 hypothetical protein HMPREF9566_00309 [Cutibacterium acnes HL045PA1]EFT29943.1 hypothetical protein HMPREF9594_00029 [Cutibacterium acnes HL005PA1]EFT30051.1 hypothetical protein HMPREF9595_02566 [Cutibacterium acnes HL005PA2]EGE95354.1 hypothetical protein
MKHSARSTVPDELHSTPSLPGVDTSSLVLAAARETPEAP